MYCPDCLIWLSCPVCPVLAIMSRLSYRSWPVPAILSQQSCPGLSWRRSPSVALMSWLVLSFLPRLTCPSCLVFYPGCTILSVFLTFLSQFSCPGFPVLAVLSRLSCPGCPVQGVLYQLSCPSFSARTPLSTALLMSLSCSGSSVLSVLSRLTHPG